VRRLRPFREAGGWVEPARRALAYRNRAGIGGGERPRARDLVVFLDLGGEVHGIADHRVFEPGLVADRAEYHGADRDRKVNGERLGPGAPPFGRPFVGGDDQRIDCAQRVNGNVSVRNTAPNVAMMPSPMNLSIQLPWRWIAATMRVS